jgi:hypothetical protein
MADEAAAEEQLRRLKNTVMGAGHRLSLLARSGRLTGDAAGELASISQELNDAVARLERLLAGIRRER